MTWIYVWTSEVKNIYVWTTPVKEAYVWTTKVRPSWWQPWANTIAYYPLTTSSTVNDMKWTWPLYNLTNNGNATFWTYGWVDCVYINNNSSVRNPLSNSSLWSQLINTAFTYSLWVNTTYVNAERWILSCNNGSWNEDRSIAVMWDATFRFYINSGGLNFAFTSTVSANTWYYIVATFDWTNMKIYLNWALCQTRPSWYSEETWQTFWIWPKHPAQNNGFVWYVSNVIVERGAWIQKKITDYFRQTKATYWIIS